MKKYMIDKKGNINPNVSLLIGLIGVGLVIAAFYFEINLYLSLLIIAIGLVLVAFSGGSTQSATLDLRAFTNDPLGWRKAKKSYEPNNSPDTAPAKDKQP